MSDPEIHHRRSIRLPFYDYSLPNYYFVTICTKNRERRLGNIINNKIKLSPIGRIVKQCWLNIPNHFPNVYLDEWIIMPNHIHGIIEITGDNLVTPRCAVGVQNFEPLQNKHQHIIPRSLGALFADLKQASPNYPDKTKLISNGSGIIMNILSVMIMNWNGSVITLAIIRIIGKMTRITRKIKWINVIDKKDNQIYHYLYQVMMALRTE